MEENKIYFFPGDMVVLNKWLPDQPQVMLVLGKTQKVQESQLKGIKCLFFDKLGVPHEYVFNTKDLTLYIDNYAE